MDRRTKCIFSRAAFGGATFSTRNFHHDTVSKCLRHMTADQARAIELAATQVWEDGLPCPVRQGFFFWDTDR
jgi:hypothetical protein